MADYRMTFDLHTHTAFKNAAGQEILHAKGTVEENVRSASEKGLTAIGISNHGPGHVTYGLPVDCIPTLLGEIQEAQARHPEIKIYFGVEANIINASGATDVSDQDFHRFNYVMAGYHYGIFGETPLRAALIHACNWVYEHAEFIRPLIDDLRWGGNEETAFQILTRINTQMMTETVRKNRLRVLTHPGDKGPFNIDEVAKACAETGTWMEINNSHRDLTVDGIKTAAKYDVKFIIGSDAHCPDCVGSFENALERAFEAGISLERIVNIEKTGSAGKSMFQEITAKKEPDAKRSEEAARTDHTVPEADKTDGAAAGNKTDGAAAVGNKADGAAAVGNKTDGAAAVGNKTDGAAAVGNEADGVAAVGNETDGPVMVEDKLDSPPAVDRLDKAMAAKAEKAALSSVPVQDGTVPGGMLQFGSDSADQKQTEPGSGGYTQSAVSSAYSEPYEANTVSKAGLAGNESAVRSSDRTSENSGKGPRRYPIRASYRQRNMKEVLSARRRTMK